MFKRTLIAAAFLTSLVGAATAQALPAEATWRAPDGRTIPQLIAAHVLPDPATTPGVVNPMATIAQACTPNWTATVRPPVAWTNKLKVTLLPAGHKLTEYELDHLDSIEDLGAPADPKNLWMMVYDDVYGARVKDVLETKLHRLICAGTITPGEAQAALAPNWLIGYQQYVGPLPK